MKNIPVECLLILGSSKNNGEQILKDASIEISKYYFVKKQSEIMKTAAYGVDFTDFFYNQAVWIESSMSIHSMITRLHKIEKSFGQKRKNQFWGDRVLDIDIIYIGNLLYYDSQINIPHESIYSREYVKNLIENIGWTNEKLW